MRPHRGFSVALYSIASLLMIPRIAGADDVPRYHLQIGQQLQFHCDRTETRTGPNASNSVRHTDWKIDVVAQNPDGSWHIVDLVDSGGTIHEMNMTVPYERLVEAGDCDLYPDGSIHGDDDPLINISRLFPLLPADANAAAAGWDDQSADHSRIIHFQSAPSDHPVQTCSFVSTTIGGIAGVFEPGSRQTYQFNRDLGLVDHVQLSIAPVDPSYSEQGEIRRVAIRPMRSSAIQKIAVASSDYDRALAAYKDMIASSATDQTAKACQARLQQTANTFIAAAFNDAEPANESLADAVNGMVSDLPTQRDILNQPAPDWTANDPQGAPHSLKDFRGKVVLLDFGSRGCSWCMREIPQLIRLSQDFKDQPVAIIGMDLDTDPQDARFIINAFRSPYLTLMASDASKGYPIEGTPTVVIIDQNGIMRRRIIGYTTSGSYEMKAAIQSLLPTKAQALSD